MSQHLWYPFTPIDSPPPLPVVRGEGAWLELADGRRILDAISSWWVTLHGHSHPAIADAIHRQALQLEQVIFAGFTHVPAEQLAAELTTLLPPGLDRVFYSDDGSTAVEVALKLARQVWTNRGEDRRRFIAFEGAYHGDTFGAMAVGARSLFTRAYDPLLFEVAFAPYPETWIGDTDVAAREAAALAELERLLREQPTAAIILEPLMQGASGMRLSRPEFLQQVASLARAHGTLLIFDEVMTGFGRTGDWFACQRAGVTPDLICLSKGLTGGFLPMGATVASEAIYDAFRGQEPERTFWHGHSYTANPLGCAAALASLELLRQAEPVVRGFEARHRQHLETLADHPRLRRLRTLGTIAALEVGDPGVSGDDGGYLSSYGPRLRVLALEEGVLLRPLGNILYLLPPLCLSDSELAGVYGAIAHILDRL